MKKYIFKFSAGMHVNKYNTSGFMMILSFGNNEGEFFFIKYRENGKFAPTVFERECKMLLMRPII